MPTISERQKERIAKLMSDPRYWDKAHPEHARVFADTERAFQDAYPEAKPDKRTSGTVHVRAYTRTQDGREIQVSEYDRTQQIAFHPLGSPQSKKSDLLQDVAEGPLHKQAKAEAAEALRLHGFIAETEMSIVSKDGVPARIDILARLPGGPLYAVEIKTPSYDDFGPNQQYVYPLLDSDKSVYSTSPRIRSLGFEPGQLLPAMCALAVLVIPDVGTVALPISKNPACWPSWFGGMWR